MADYAAPSVYPYVDAPSTVAPLLSVDYNQVVSALVDLGGSSGRVKSLETNAVRSVIVSTGSEARPTAAVVIWVSPGSITPADAISTDLVFMPSGGTTATANSVITAALAATAARADAASATAAITAAIAATASTGTVAASTAAIVAAIVATAARSDAASATSAITAGITATASAGSLFADDFNRADGAVGNGWVAPGGGTLSVASNAMTYSGWTGYARAYQGSLPRRTSVRAIFTGTLTQYHGIFLAHSATTGTGLKLFNNAGTWVIGNSSAYNANNTNVSFSGTPSTPYTTLRLDYDDTTVTCYINGTVVHTTTPGTLGITLDTASGSVYQVGYCGEATTPNLDDFQVWSA